MNKGIDEGGLGLCSPFVGLFDKSHRLIVDLGFPGEREMMSKPGPSPNRRHDPVLGFPMEVRAGFPAQSCWYKRGRRRRPFGADLHQIVIRANFHSAAASERIRIWISGCRSSLLSKKREASSPRAVAATMICIDVPCESLHEPSEFEMIVDPGEAGLAGPEPHGSSSTQVRHVGPPEVASFHGLH